MKIVHRGYPAGREFDEEFDDQSGSMIMNLRMIMEGLLEDMESEKFYSEKWKKGVEFTQPIQSIKDRGRTDEGVAKKKMNVQQFDQVPLRERPVVDAVRLHSS